MNRWVAILLLFATAFIGMQSVSAQFIAPDRKVVVIQRPPPPGFPRLKKRPAFQGVLPQLFRLKKPWEVINPYAPPEYGNGSENATYWDWSKSFVTKDPMDQSYYHGITIFGISW